MSGAARDGTRQRGIDLQADPAAVRELNDEAAAAILAEWAADDARPPADAGALARHAFSAVASFGPLPQILDDPLIGEFRIKNRLTAGKGERRRVV